ncbi:Response regulator receiver domain-containing protein [Catalinimonas alkaloidigena]|uniref:Response regulator receiver domain-containing protein n=1 Tax=Catalinimonas alkaloidigena TaxID=1075417 RepID=A0A1G9P2H0_9BACT|nr:response regulator [Catalinimonas alkaloidigena]SDL92447.1 Response regulator receiver domain-containing protein [Catalinimonas alkaloidigena]
MLEKIVNILLVEDDYLDVMDVERNLKKINVLHKLYVARNGEEALAMLRGGGAETIDPLPSLIMLDINMPKMNGIEFLQELRQDPALKHIKVFIMTTSDHEEDRSAAQELGISGYIVKPLKFSNKFSATDSFNLFIDLLNLKK